MTYTVKYKRKGSFFWKTIKNVRADFVPTDLESVRVLILSDETRIEIPLRETEFWFSRDRFLSIKAKVDQEAGQVVPVKQG